MVNQIKNIYNTQLQLMSDVKSSDNLEIDSGDLECTREDAKIFNRLRNFDVVIE